MDYFRKVPLNHAAPCGATGVCDSLYSKTTEFEKEGKIYLTTEIRKISQEQKKDLASIPNVSDYQLEIMLKNGFKPLEVPVSGLLNSDDPLDSSNVNAVSNGMSKLESLEKESSVNVESNVESKEE